MHSSKISCIFAFPVFLFLLNAQSIIVLFMSLTFKILTFYYAVFPHPIFSLIDATHKDVDVLLLLSNSAYYVA